MRFGRRLASMIGVIVAATALASGMGFAWFMHEAGQTRPPAAHTDGIVAFTGGPERVETALRLMSEGRADRLLLSGIGGGAELPELAHRAGIDPLPVATRITIGRTATTTRGNASETAAWARANTIHSLMVVTAAYHMPRALTELARALPDVTLYPMPVRPDRAPTPLRVVAEEYVKFLATAAGLSSMLPPRELPQPHGAHAG